MNFFIGLVALLVERHAGYPRAIERVISHPVVWIGAFISQFEQAQNRPDISEGERRAAGIVMLVILVSICAFAGLVAVVALRNLPFGWVLEGVIASAFVSYRQLGAMVEDVQRALSGDLETFRVSWNHKKSPTLGFVALPNGEPVPTSPGIALIGAADFRFSFPMVFSHGFVSACARNYSVVSL